MLTLSMTGLVSAQNQGTINSADNDIDILFQQQGVQPTNPVNAPPQNTTISPTPASNSESLRFCSGIRFDSLLDILIWLRCIIGIAIIPLFFALALLLFLWGVLKFMYSAGNEKERSEGKKFIYWGIIALVVMVSVWGLVRLLTTTFGLGNTVPQLQTEKDCLKTGNNNPCK